jgi:cation transport regulator ChaC
MAGAAGGEKERAPDAADLPIGPRGLWVFGYGSLVWRVDFPHAEHRPAAVRGWRRRFWQGSTDHRGVPGAPGRVVTLQRAPGAVCWGVAYRVAPPDVPAVLAHLDHREKGGYERHRVRLHFGSGPGQPRVGDEADGLLYVASRQNPEWLGPAPLAEIVRTIARSRGPSGANAEYVHRLHAALRALGARDGHVAAIAAALRRHEAEDGEVR